MDDYWWLIVAGLPPLEIVWVVIASVYIVLQRRSAHATLAWIFTLALFPVLGIILYTILGPRRYERRKKRRARAVAAVQESSTMIDAHPSEGEVERTQLARMLEGTVGRAGRPRCADIRLFFDGKSMYEALETAIRGASRHVHLEYYIWEPDVTGTQLRDLLVERAEAGVEVRVLVDGFGSSNAHDHFWEPLRAAGGRVRRFNEVTLMRWRPRMVNFRTHRKIVVIDGHTGFTGGMNITDVHTSAVSKEAAWRDTHLELRGPAVKGLQMVFFEDWHYAGGDGPDVERYLPAVPGPECGSYVAQIVSSGPDENLDAIHKLFFVAIAGAKERVLLTTPYFVPDDTVLAALTAAALGGVDVRVLVPEGGDQPFIAAAARSYYPELLEAGVKIYQFEQPVLHSKTLVVDDLAVVGTANTDTRSFRLNFEVVVAMEERAISDQLVEAFERDLSSAHRVTLDALRKAPLRRRLVSSVARLFSPIL